MKSRLAQWCTFAAFFAACFALPVYVLATPLSCTMTTAALCTSPKVIALRLVSTSNSHSELPSQATANYANNVVCCAGGSSLSNSCTGNYAVMVNLAMATNSHVQENDRSGYANPACLSSTSGIVIGYQDTNCSGYDTSLGSISSTTNAHFGTSTAYTRQICGSAVPLLTVASSTPQPTSVLSPSTGNIMGSMSVIVDSGTVSVTAVTVRQHGSINGNTQLANVKLWLNSTDNTLTGATQIGSTGTFDANGNVTFTGTFTVTTSLQYLIVTTDVLSGVSAGTTIDIQFTNLATTAQVIAAPGNYSEEQLQALDWVIYQAGLRNIRLMLVLVNNWDAYGGMDWYVSQATSTNKTLTGDPYHDQFYTDANVQGYYKQYVAHLLNHVNIYDGLAYKNDPRIFAWALTNEGRAKSDGNRALGTFLNWVTMMSAYVKSIDSNHLLTTGIEGWGEPYEGTAFTLSQAPANIDFASMALYPDSWSWFAQRSENGSGGTIPAGISSAVLNWWTSDTTGTWNNTGGAVSNSTYVPNTPPARYGYKNWVQQNLAWGTSTLVKPVVMQELGLMSTYSYALRYQFYTQAIHTFYANGGQGLILWNLNHDNYYYSTSWYPGEMDDGYGFYVSTDPTLKAKSQPVIDAIAFAKTDNSGGSWINVPTDMTHFVTTSGATLKLNGSPYIFMGTNAYYLADYARNTTYDNEADLITSSQTYATQILNEAQTEGFNVIRTWAFGSGSQSIPTGGKYNLFEIGSTPVDLTGSTTVSSAAQSLTFSISQNSVSFGNLSAGAASYATTTGSNGSDTIAHTLTVATNAVNGYNLTVQGATLTSLQNPAKTIAAITGSPAASSVGTPQFGLYATSTSGTVITNYAGLANKFYYGATGTTADTLATNAAATAGDTYNVHYLANIGTATPAGSYATSLVYVATANF